MSTIVWTFLFGEEGWVHVDGSSGNASSSMAHITGALENTLTFTGTAPSDFAISDMLFSINIPVQNGDTLEVDFEIPDAKNMGVHVQVDYNDATNESSSASRNGDGTQTLTITENKTVEQLVIEFNRPGNVHGEIGSFSPLNTEVRLTTSATLGLGEKPMGLDIDVEDGSKTYVTYWNDHKFFLREYSTDLVVQNTHEITSGPITIAELNNRTSFLSPHCPAFFGTAGLNNIVYIYGRWDDGTVTHLAKSIDGGASFTDIGDSATWGAGWVGAFFAVDTNTLLAFVNDGASSALYRTTNGGTNWIQLSLLPFEVDPGGASGHPDGRILISNRDAAAQMVAYAEGLDYSSWVNATDAFPTGGSGSPAIIWVV